MRFLGIPAARKTPIRATRSRNTSDLHDKHRLKAAHFERWLALFQSTVDGLFEGPVANDAKFRAYAIAETWKMKFDA
ncbi:MAG: hypothetical protein IPN33_25795 [Saprospiraceae bacterium]|nr:hypothetical protein [Saprospiraceae bacterium]